MAKKARNKSVIPEENKDISLENSVAEEGLDGSTENVQENNSEPENEEKSIDLQENTADKNDGSAADETQGEEVKKISFRERLDLIQDAVAKFIAENNLMARFIGLFMMFASIVCISNYNSDPRTEPFTLDSDKNFTDRWKDYSGTVSFAKMFLFIGLIFIGVSLLRKFIPKLKQISIDGYILVAGVMSFGISSLWRANNELFSFSIILVSVILFSCFIKSDEFSELKKVPNKVYIIIMCLCAVLVGAYVAWTTICKHRIFNTAVFDLGIFTQMYYSIINDFTQVTTCERGYPLSHFAVHFSPIYYVLAPLYMIHPSAETLLAAQAVLAVSGFIPLYLICRKYKFSDTVSFLFSLVYIFSTSVMSPCYYEFHENAFLPPLLMWLFYAIEKEKKILMYIMVVMVLMVKEDAALYIMCISLYLVFSGKNRKHGTIIFLATVAVFVNVLTLMSRYGEGAMTNRTFGNLMINYDGGFGEVIKTVLSNPVYFIAQCFTQEKFIFLIIMLLPLMFMPFITNKPSRMLLVVPFIVMNLASGYPYAFKYDFQYVFGTATCLIYAALVNVADLDGKAVRRVVPLMAAASVLMFTANDSRQLYYPDTYKSYREQNDRKAAYIESIPEDASVLATSFIIPHAANRKELYILDEGSSVNPDTCDFVVFEDGNDEWKINKRAMLEEEGYEVFVDVEGLIVIYVSPDYVFD